MDAKTIAWVQVVGAVVAGWLVWSGTSDGLWSPAGVLAVVLLVMGFNSLSGKKR